MTCLAVWSSLNLVSLGQRRLNCLGNQIGEKRDEGEADTKKEKIELRGEGNYCKGPHTHVRVSVCGLEHVHVYEGLCSSFPLLPSEQHQSVLTEDNNTRLDLLQTTDVSHTAARAPPT